MIMFEIHVFAEKCILRTIEKTKPVAVCKLTPDPMLCFAPLRPDKPNPDAERQMPQEEDTRKVVGLRDMSTPP